MIWALDTYCQVDLRQTLLFVCPIAIPHFFLVYGTAILLGQYVKEGEIFPQLPEPKIRLVKAKHNILFLSVATALRVGMWLTGYKRKCMWGFWEKIFLTDSVKPATILAWPV